MNFRLTWKCSLVKFYNWFGAISSFHSNFFASSILLDLLLELEEDILKNVNTDTNNSKYTKSTWNRAVNDYSKI